MKNQAIVLAIMSLLVTSSAMADPMFQKCYTKTISKLKNASLWSTITFPSGWENPSSPARLYLLSYSLRIDGKGDMIQSCVADTTGVGTRCEQSVWGTVQVTSVASTMVYGSAPFSTTASVINAAPLKGDSNVTIQGPLSVDSTGGPIDPNWLSEQYAKAGQNMDFRVQMSGNGAGASNTSTAMMSAYLNNLNVTLCYNYMRNI